MDPLVQMLLFFTESVSDESVADVLKVLETTTQDALERIELARVDAPHGSELRIRTSRIRTMLVNEEYQKWRRESTE
jgi:hypothetical protein